MNIKIALVALSSNYDNKKYELAKKKACSYGLDIVFEGKNHNYAPTFINGCVEDRINDFKKAKSSDAHAIWCVRGGVGASMLWQAFLEKELDTKKPLIGYSDVTILHFVRYLKYNRIGIHGPVFSDLAKECNELNDIVLLLNRRSNKLSYEPLREIKSSKDVIKGPSIIMNLTSLQSIVGLFGKSFFNNKILMLEDVNEPHYKVHRALWHLWHLGFFDNLKALVIGQFTYSRSEIISESFLPIAKEKGIPLFDWPIFGHDNNNMPLLFGAKCQITRMHREAFHFSYLEHFDKSLA